MVITYVQTLSVEVSLEIKIYGIPKQERDACELKSQ